MTRAPLLATRQGPFESFRPWMQAMKAIGASAIVAMVATSGCATAPPPARVAATTKPAPPDPGPEKFTRTLSVAAPGFQSSSIDISVGKARMEEHGQSLKRPAFRIEGTEANACNVEIVRVEVLEDGGQGRAWPATGANQQQLLWNGVACVKEMELLGPTIRPPAKKLRVYLRHAARRETPIDIALAYGRASPAEAAVPPPALTPECAALKRCCEALRAKSEKDADACDDQVELGAQMGTPEFCQSALPAYAKEGGCGP